MPNTYEVELSDGRVVEIEGERPPTEQEAHALLKDYQPTEPEFSPSLPLKDVLLRKKDEGYFTRPEPESFLTAPMGGEIRLVREPKTAAEGLYNALAKLGGSMVSPLGAGLTVAAPIPALQPAVKGLVAGLGAKGLGELYGTLSVPQAQPKTVGGAIETLGDIAGGVAMTAAGVPEFGRAATSLLTERTPDAIEKRIIQESRQPEYPGTAPLRLPAEAGGGYRPQPETPVQEKVTAATYTNPETGVTTTGANHPEAGEVQGVKVPEAQADRQGPEYNFQVADQSTGETKIVTPNVAEDVAAKAGQLIEPSKEGERITSSQIKSPTQPGVPLSESEVAKAQEKVEAPLMVETPQSRILKNLGYSEAQIKGMSKEEANRLSRARPRTDLDKRIQDAESSLLALEHERGIERGAGFLDLLRDNSKKLGWTDEQYAKALEDAVGKATAIPVEARPAAPKELPAPTPSDVTAIPRKPKDVPQSLWENPVARETILNHEANIRRNNERLKETNAQIQPLLVERGQLLELHKGSREQKVMGGLAPRKIKAYAITQRIEALRKEAQQIRDNTAAEKKLRTNFVNSWEIGEPTPPKPAEPGTAGEIVGMGGAVPSEFVPSSGSPTSIKNVQVDAERAKRGLPPAIQPVRRSFGEVWDRAMAMVDQDPAIQDNLIDSLRNKPRALTDTEDALLLHRQIDLQNEYGKATRDLAQAYEDNRIDAVNAERVRVARLSDQLLDLYNIGKKVGTETGRGLNARKMLANEDFTLAKMTLEKRVANGGRALTDSEHREIQALHDKINATQKAYDDYVAATQERMAKMEVERVIAEQKAAAAPRFDKRILAQAEKIVQGMEKFAEPAAQRLRERLARLGTSPDPAIIYDAAVVGSARIARLGLDLAKFTDSMVSDFGEKIRPFMQAIWAESNKMLDSVTAKAPEVVRRVVKKADLTETKAAIGENIKDKAAKGQKDKITWQVHKLARSLVEHGITDREQLIDAVHEVLQDAIPGITRRESMDAISGYGDFKQLSKDQISVTLRGMKGEMQQLAKLEDMAKGQPPLKSGLERRTPTEVERKLIKEVNDAKYKFQVPVEDPNVQLQSALDTLKKTLANRITDYQDRIARGDYAKRPRRELILDAEASRLKAENERVKKIFQRGVAMDRLKNMSQVERTGDLIAQWRRGFILSAPTVLGKLTSAAVQRMAFTPMEEIAGVGVGTFFPKLAARAPRQGGLNVSAEAKAITQSLTRGIEDAWKVLKTGQSDLDILYGKEALLPPAVIDFFGHVHGALKAPTKRAEFARSLEKRTQWHIAQGLDVSDPMVQSKLVIDAYKDAMRSIFLQDNRVVDFYKRGLAALERRDKITGEVPLSGKAGATAGRVLLPIVKVPTNIVAETMEYATGLITGSARLAKAYRAGIENLPPEQADLIMRQLKKGSVGAAVLALGYANPEVIGGYYQPGQRRKPKDVKPGMIRLYGIDVPSWLLHNPLLETLQLGATIRRVSDSKLRKRDTENQGIVAGIGAGIIGLGEEVPFAREMLEISKAFNPHERGAFFGELGKSLLVPQVVQQIAKWTDPFQETPTRKRKPQTVWQRIEMGVPYLRQEVPVRTVRP